MVSSQVLCKNVAKLLDPYCHGLQELPSAVLERARVAELLCDSGDSADVIAPSPLYTHLSHGLAYTTGSALGYTPPSADECLEGYIKPKGAGLTAGARAWSKHAHRSQSFADEAETDSQREARKISAGWWGTPSGPVKPINEKALELFWKITNEATWRNLHWLPHQILVYEVRVAEGYGMRWAQEWTQDEVVGSNQPGPWIFRGFVEPMMENGHEVGWRH